jgi:hypothetical protein
MELRYDKVAVEQPGGRLKRERYPEMVAMWVVQAKQETGTVRPGEAGVEWNLYTSHPVETAEAARKIIEYYRSRWLIEDLFRMVKREGVKYEESELETGTGKQRSSLVFDGEQLD